ncbi:MAG TPA: peptidase inhibitor I78 family protein [Erwinia sp.]|uniref:I78 family peptidase inhibitor n=1 Tax=Erwinia citreus TaxID=558 RepID=UPI000E83583C|nr:I78 family peptidase inhibitor [Erwinia sp.]HBV39448.1 peptidase inhibitor I78 family protein [Erwinia sp.]
MIDKKVLTAFAAVLLLAGCQSGAQKGAASGPNDPEMDRCGASDYQQYVGKPLSAIDGLRFEHPVRAIPWNAAVTMDFNLNRLNFMGDSQNKITQVYCG